MWWCGGQERGARAPPAVKRKLPRVLAGNKGSALPTGVCVLSGCGKSGSGVVHVRVGGRRNDADLDAEANDLSVGADLQAALDLGEVVRGDDHGAPVDDVDGAGCGLKPRPVSALTPHDVRDWAVVVELVRQAVQ